MPRIQVPQLTVIFPAVDVRGPAAHRLRTWTQGQTLAREHYRVVVGCDGTAPLQESELAELLAPGDELVRVLKAPDVELWNAGAICASTPWLVFTEGHCLAHSGCLQAVTQWIAANPNAEVGNFAIDHDDNVPLAGLNRRWFGMILDEWSAQWPRVHRSGFAIRTDLFEEVGGFESAYGQFAPQLLSARLHLHGVKVKPVPGALILHEDDERMREHHAATANFMRGLVKARSRSNPVFFERYFGYGPDLAGYPGQYVKVARRVARVAAASALSNPRLAAKLASQICRLAGGWIAGLTPRIIFHRLALAIEDVAVDWLPLPASLRWWFFLRAHQRAIRLQFLKSASSAAIRVFPKNLGRCPVDELPAKTVFGMHQLEHYEGRPFRWTEPFLLLRPEVTKGGIELRIETLEFRGDPLAKLIAVIVGDHPLPPQWVTASTEGTLIVRLPQQSADTAREGILFVFAPVSAGGADGRCLGLPILSIGSGPIGKPFELHGPWDDQWAAPSTMIHAFELSAATLNLEVPGFLPFTFPVVIKATQDGREIARAEASVPGDYTLDVPITKPGIIELSADQWFVPVELGIATDERRLSYRITQCSGRQRKRSPALGSQLDHQAAS
jgi:hypothetical protein